MHARNPTLPEPPKRPPYIQVIVQGVTYTLRAPSLAKVGALIQRLPEQQRYHFLGLPSVVASGTPIMSALAGSPDMFALLAAAIGVCWADGAWGLDTPLWTEGSPIPYGEAVYEELHEAGWALDQIAMAVLHLAQHVAEQNTLSAEVVEKTAFFRLRTDSSTESESESSSSTSAATEGGASTN